MAAPLKRSATYPPDAKMDGEEIWKTFNELIAEENRLIESLKTVEADPPAQTDSPSQTESPNSSQAYSVVNLLNQRSVLKKTIEIVNTSYAEEVSKRTMLEARVEKLKSDVSFYLRLLNKANADCSKLIDKYSKVKNEKKALIDEFESEVNKIGRAVETMKGLVSAGPSSV